MKRWKSLRDHFVRELRKKKKRPSGGAGPEYKYTTIAKPANLSKVQ